ncbi:putative methyltransferase [Colletotrichum tabaci]|uniref:Methyltransferase n=1 Tax=Colletotrichum tabaci TaxID=1209068 RepID=A0AAV9SS17_9PEZI
MDPLTASDAPFPATTCDFDVSSRASLPATDSDPHTGPPEEALPTAGLDDPYDSAVGFSDGEWDTESIPSEYDNTEEKYGWEYHVAAADSYHCPTNGQEKARLESQYKLFREALGKYHLLKLTQSDKGPVRVLDIGTATGLWAIDYADNDPKARVIGVDLRQVQPNV